MKIARVGAARRPLLASPLASQRTNPAQRAPLPLVVRATASPKGHAERAATAASKTSTSTPLATTTSSPHQLQSGAATSAAQLPFTTALFVRAFPGILRFAPSLLMPTTAALGVVGALHGADAAHALLDALPPTLLDALPAAAEVKTLYESHGAAVDGALDAAASLAAVLFAFVVMPLGDLVFGQEPEAEMPPTRSKSGSGSSSKGGEAFNPYRGWLHAYAFLHLAALAAGAAAAPGMSPLALLGAALSLGTSGANAFTCAHELGHSRSPRERALADVLLAAQGLPYWRAAHAAHHRNVGLPGDPETALLGEGFWEFLPRALRGGLRDALASDAARSRARAAKEARDRSRPSDAPSSSSSSPPPPPSPLDLLRHSDVPRWAGSAAAAVALAAALGASGATAAAASRGGESGGASSAFPAAAAGAGLALLGVQAAFSVLWLEAVEYIEHFGLSRASPLEKVQPYHSWNANFSVTNAVTFRLQRHSDHHAHAEKSFETLRDEPDAPQLPASYPVMMITAVAFPALFRRVMEPRARAEQAKNEARRERERERRRGGGRGGGEGGGSGVSGGVVVQ